MEQPNVGNLVEDGGDQLTLEPFRKGQQKLQISHFYPRLPRLFLERLQIGIFYSVRARKRYVCPPYVAVSQPFPASVSISALYSGITGEICLVETVHYLEEASPSNSTLNVKLTHCRTAPPLADISAVIGAKSAVMDFSRTPVPLLPSKLPENRCFHRNNGPGVQFGWQKGHLATNSGSGVHKKRGLMRFTRAWRIVPAHALLAFPCTYRNRTASNRPAARLQQLVTSLIGRQSQIKSICSASIWLRA